MTKFYTLHQNQPGHHAPGFFASTLRRIIADVHGVPDFLDPCHPIQPHLFVEVNNKVFLFIKFCNSFANNP